MVIRDANGKFTKGSDGGPGRPKRVPEGTFMEVLTGAVTPGRWLTIVEKAIQQAERGDPVARKWLADYLIGSPIQKIAPTDPTGENQYMQAEIDDLIDLVQKFANVTNTDN